MISRKIWIALGLLLIGNLSFAQKKNQVYFSLGPSIGAFTYQGDLAESFSVKSTNLAFGAVGNLHFDSHLYARLQVAHGWVQAADSNSSDQQKKFRNLSFRTPITEVSMQLVYDFFGVTRSVRYRPKYTPYVYAGIGIFSFNPQAKALNSKGEEQWFDLQPLGTEGQYLINGAGNYPEPYALTQIMIPFGAGVKFKLTEKLNLAVEVGARKIFTDYLDDVSDKYAPRDQILAQMGPVAYQLADRSGYTQAGGSGFEANDLRGNKNSGDWYFHTNVNLTYIFGSKDKCPRFNFRN